MILLLIALLPLTSMAVTDFGGVFGFCSSCAKETDMKPAVAKSINRSEEKVLRIFNII
jgi:hypothetical protein